MDNQYFRPQSIFHSTIRLVGMGVGPLSPVYSIKDNEISDPLTLFCTRSSSKAEIVSMIESSQEKERSQQQHKAEMAFKLMDRNNDGYVTKQEMLSTTKKLTQKQVGCRIETKLMKI